MKKITIGRVSLHLVFWVFFFLASNAYYAQPGKYNYEIWFTLLMLPFYMLFTYPQVYFFIPKLLLKKKILLYTIVSLVYAKIIWWLHFLFYNRYVYPVKFGTPLEEFWYNPPWEIHLEGLRNAFPMVMICGVAASIKLLKKWHHQNDRNQKIETEKAVMELEILKAQVHPHFLFNTLNNLYSLTLTRSENAPTVVTHLSDLLRYMLYECNEKEVPLHKEIDTLKKYVELEKLRYGSRLDISFYCSGDTDALLIAPLLLLPLVENSFKHGVSDQIEQCWINLYMHAEQDTFTFNLSNSCNKEKLPLVKGGIGLPNLQKRLELIYKDMYELHITSGEEMYSINLKMQLSARPAVAQNNSFAFDSSLPIPAL